jgi:small-conductance mechanosensitive channel
VAGVLSKIIGVFLFAVCVVIFISMLGVDFISFITPLGAAVLAISFVFGNVASDAFRSFIFLFFVHAYDVGDKLEICSSPFSLLPPSLIVAIRLCSYAFVRSVGLDLRVEQITLLATTAYATDGRYYVLNNAEIAQAIVINRTRSKAFACCIDLLVEMDTSLETVWFSSPTTLPCPCHIMDSNFGLINACQSIQIQKLRDAMKRWLKKRKDMYEQNFSIQLTDIINQSYLKLNFWVRMKNVNWDYAMFYLNSQTELLSALKAKCDELGIRCKSMEQVVSIKQGQMELKPPPDWVKAKAD